MAINPALSIIARQSPLIEERLRIAFPEKVFAFERVPMAMSLREFNRVSRLTPFLGLAWMGMKTGNDARLLSGTMQWRLFLVYAASSGLEARFKGDMRGLGLDAMTDVAAVVLNGVSFDDAGVITVTGANPIVADGFADDNIALAQLDFSFSFVASTAELALETADDFDALGVTWALATSDDITPQDEITGA
ncbi:hypothetical protein [Martelella radicis]|uniref:DUF1834 family protein n=1 Tax=Martelella radicis TaxID=1397476 RepID=A0A7W6PA25_9HYPH|nr:hypothetical protein [Martelella radicis]MBB4122917.1 hypothetical protein [Martelella radicis]